MHFFLLMIYCNSDIEGGHTVGTLTLRTAYYQDFTMISNAFLDDYMPRANGEFVKVYLMLLRICAGGGEPLTLGRLADLLNCTENDVIRAIRYWEKEKLLLLRTDEAGEVTDIMLTTPAVPAEAMESRPRISLNTEAIPADTDNSRSGRVSVERAAELCERSDIVEMRFIAEQYLGKLLTPTELQKLLYFYDDLHFSTDLIDYLIEYCVSNDHKSFRYIEKVAYNWYESGIRTVHDARSSINNYHKDYYEILKAFGIRSRNPVKSEITYMKKWLNTWHFSLDIIREACERTVLSAGKASFRYADSILNRWHDEGVISPEDIARLDSDHEARARRDARSTERDSAKPGDFNNFAQRSYDYEALEDQLLKGSR